MCCCHEPEGLQLDELKLKPGSCCSWQHMIGRQARAPGKRGQGASGGGLWNKGA